MRLLGIMLQQAGLSFMTAQATHHPLGMSLNEIVCKTGEEAQRVNEWAIREGFAVVARVATPEEREEHERLA